MTEDEGPGELARKIDRLFRTAHPRGKDEISYREVAKAIEERGGPTISASYLHALRTGSKDNPTKRHLEAIAEFFRVPPAYFFNDELGRRIDSQLELLESLRDAGVRHIALRASELSPESVDMIREIIDRLPKIEGGDG